MLNQNTYSDRQEQSNIYAKFYLEIVPNGDEIKGEPPLFRQLLVQDHYRSLQENVQQELNLLSDIWNPNVIHQRKCGTQ
jgi:hypothetical protein